MFARHVSMHLKPNTRAEFTQMIENEILPLLRKQHGFQDEIAFVAPDLERKWSPSVFGTRRKTRRPITAEAIQNC
jgi:hypothetical protein